MATSNLSHSISRSDCAIKTPTMIKAGAVTWLVTTANNGEKNKPTMKSKPVVTAVNPERPPTAMLVKFPAMSQLTWS